MSRPFLEHVVKFEAMICEPHVGGGETAPVVGEHRDSGYDVCDVVVSAGDFSMVYTFTSTDDRHLLSVLNSLAYCCAHSLGGNRLRLGTSKGRRCGQNECD
jgi:hypothetical protein